MIRRSLKDKELQYITANDVRGISSGSELEVLLASANQSNGYFLGHNGTAATSYANNTNIFSQEGEYAYLLSKGAYSSANINNFKFHLRKTSSSLYLYKDDKSAALTSVPTKTVSGLILKNTYNNVTRYLGVNGTSVTSTTDEMEAKFNEIYHWEMQYQNSSGRFIFHNPSSGRNIRYSGNSFSLNTSGTSLYVKYTSNAFTIAGSNTSNFMYMSSDTALARTTSTTASQRLWTITQVNLLAPTCVDEPVEGLTALPTATVNNVLLRNTYNGTIRYLGMTTSNGVTSTTDLDTALADDYYRWNLVYYSSGRFKIQNAQVTSRYIRYSRGYSISTTSSNLYFKYVSGSGFTIAGASSTSSPYYMYMSGTTTLARSQNTAYYWDILVDKSSLFEGWVNAKALTIETASPNTTTSILAGYNTSGILTLGETCGSMSVYLNHGTSLSGLDYTKDKTDANCAWVLYDINKINHGGNGGGSEPEPTGPKLLTATYTGYATNPMTAEITYPYGTSDRMDITVTVGGTSSGLVFYWDDGSTFASGTTIHWDSMTESTSHTGNIGWAPSSGYTYALTNGMTLGVANNQDTDGTTHNGSIRFMASGSSSASWPVTYTFKGVYFE